MDWLKRMLGLRERGKDLPLEEAEKLNESQREILEALKILAKEARDEEALKYARERERDLNRLQQEYELYEVGRR